MLNPVPAVMVTVADREGNANIITIAWAGTICSSPAMVSISVRPERYSYHMLQETGEFVINLTTQELVRACDYCGVTSGRTVDKFKETGLTPLPIEGFEVPGIEESPVNLACRVVEEKKLGSHSMFLAEVVSVTVDEKYLDEKGKFRINETGLVCYSHGEYFGLGEKLGSFGYSIRKKPSGRKKPRNLQKNSENKSATVSKREQK